MPFLVNPKLTGQNYSVRGADQQNETQGFSNALCMGLSPPPKKD